MTDVDIPIIDLTFTDAFLGLEHQPTLSMASGHNTCSQHPDSEGEGLTWLIEPKRTKVVQRFSHTLHHKSRQLDLLSLTIAAFSHFVYGHSNSSLVLADIQGERPLQDSRIRRLISTFILQARRLSLMDKTDSSCSTSSTILRKGG